MTDEAQTVEERLTARAAEPQPESWKHEKEGDQIVGRFRRLEKGSTTYGDCWIVVLESLRTPGRLSSVWLFNTTLFNEFKKARPKPGETVLVRYEGRVQRQGQSDYHLWKVVVDRPENESAYSWGDLGADEAAPADTDTRNEVGPRPDGDFFPAGEPSGGPNGAPPHGDEDVPF